MTLPTYVHTMMEKVLLKKEGLDPESKKNISKSNSLF